jgi:phospholipase C
VRQAEQQQLPRLARSTCGALTNPLHLSASRPPSADNFDDNGFAWFANFQNAQPGSPLYDRGMARQPDLVAAFGADLAAGTLPQVSWIVGPANLSEHATYHPGAGEDLSARIIAQLGLHPATYASTVFILNYGACASLGGWRGRGGRCCHGTPGVRR